MDKKKPLLFMMVGLPGSGKTTRAKELESEQAAFRFTPDDWILDLFNIDDRFLSDTVRDPIEKAQWQVAKRALELGNNVILDFGFWTKAERMKYRQEAEALGAQVKIVSLDMTTEELWSRISEREESKKGALHITREELEEWAARFEKPSEEELNSYEN